MTERLDLLSGPLSLDRTLVMGILNRTPDSFYDGGRYPTVDAALRRVAEMIDEDADIVDIGGEKAGPGRPVDVAEEIERVVPAIRAIRERFPIAISVDTFKPAVARAAMQVGADIINNIDGFRDPEMIRVAADSGAAVVIMHIQGTPRVAHPEPTYTNVVTQVRDFLLDRGEACLAAGVAPDRVIVDPGLGFGKRPSDDIVLLRRLGDLTALPYPLLLAASRKPFIAGVLGGGPGERLEGSLAVAAWGIVQGARLLRVHDVRATVRVARMTEAVVMAEAPV